jgi:hypothetical protein
MLSFSIPPARFWVLVIRYWVLEIRTGALYTIYYTICTSVVQSCVARYASLIVGLVPFFSLTQYRISNGSQIC